MSAGITPVHYQSFPGSLIGRAIAYYPVRFADMRNGDGKLDQEHFRKAVQTIQTSAEILWISVPYISDNYGAFQVAVSIDTLNEFPHNGNSIQDALRAVLSDGNIVFRREYLVGSNWYVESDFIEYCDSNYVKDINGIPMVFTGVEQLEFAAKYEAYYA